MERQDYRVDIIANNWKDGVRVNQYAFVKVTHCLSEISVTSFGKNQNTALESALEGLAVLVSLWSNLE